MTDAEALDLAVSRTGHERFRVLVVERPEYWPIVRSIAGGEIPRPPAYPPLRAQAWSAIMALALTPRGFSVGEVAAKVQEIGGQACRDYGVRQAAYDLRKLRAKQLVEKPGHSRRYQVLDQGLQTIIALVVLREHVLKPLLAAASHPTAGDPVRRKIGRKPKAWSPIDEHYQALRSTMRALLDDLHLAAA